MIHQSFLDGLKGLRAVEAKDWSVEQGYVPKTHKGGVAKKPDLSPESGVIDLWLGWGARVVLAAARIPEEVVQDLDLPLVPPVGEF